MKTFQIPKVRQDVRDSRYTKNHSLLSLRGRRLKGNGKGVLGARETQGAALPRSLPPCAPLASPSRPKPPFLSFSNAYHAGYSLLNLRFWRHKRRTRPRPGATFLTSVTSSTSAAYALYCIQDGNRVPRFSLLPVEGRVGEDPGNEVVQDCCRFATHALLPIFLEESWVLE